MTPQELKASILQLAIQGKLVEQRPEEGTGEELFHQIQAEKQRLIKAGTIKKEKLLPEIAEDEIPFDIPDSWCWVRLADLVDIYTGKKDANFGSPDGEYDFFTCSNQPIKCKSYSYDGEYLIMPGNGANIGMVTHYNGKFEAYQRTYLLENVYGIFVDYLKYHLEANWKQYNADKMYGSAIPYIKLGNLTNYCVALPPLAEQKRIVAKIAELLPYIDRYEQAWSKLEDFNKRFPVDMQKSILQMAIQGKLVDQRPEEGTGEELFHQIQAEKQRLIKAGTIKKEKPLPEIAEDEVPFDIPGTWRWVHFSDILDVRDGTHDTPKYVTDGVPLVTSKNLVAGGIDFDTTKLISFEDAQAINMRSAVDNGDILFAMIGTIGNPVLVKKDREFCIKNMALFKAINQDLISMEYVLLFLQNEQHAMKKKASGGVQSFVSLKFLRSYLIPLPPIAEQKRIVAKLEEILPLCDRLK